MARKRSSPCRLDVATASGSSRGSKELGRVKLARLRRAASLGSRLDLVVRSLCGLGVVDGSRMDALGGTRKSSRTSPLTDLLQFFELVIGAGRAGGAEVQAAPSERDWESWLTNNY